MEEISVIVVDDQRLIREGISSLLEIQEGVKVVGTGTTGDEAIELVRRLTPDVVLMDIQMPGTDGITATGLIKEEFPDTCVIMLTTFDDDDYIIKSLKAGAVGYLLKDIPSEDLAQAVRLAHSGIFQLSPTVAGKLVGDIRSRRTPKAEADQPLNLTDREKEVLILIAQGASNREIAERLCVSEGTVKNHVSNILTRLGLRDRTQAALFAYNRGLTE